MTNLHNWYKLTERKISQKKQEYMLNYSLPCSVVLYRFIIKQQWTMKEISILVTASIWAV
jgi:hypothetical protein